MLAGFSIPRGNLTSQISYPPWILQAYCILFASKLPTRAQKVGSPEDQFRISGSLAVVEDI